MASNLEQPRRSTHRRPERLAPPGAANALVIYYSRSGYTAQAASRMAALLQATSIPITEPFSRRGLLGWLRCARDTAGEALSPVNPFPVDLREFDVVVVGTPVWFGRVASPVRSFLCRYRFELPPTAFFLTSAHAEPDRVFGELQRLSGKVPLATLSLQESDFEAHAAALTEGRISSYAAATIEALRRRSPRFQVNSRSF